MLSLFPFRRIQHFPPRSLFIYYLLATLTAAICFSACGNAAVSSTSTTVSAPLRSPSNVQVARGSTEDTITWDAVTGAQSYNVYASTTATARFKTLAGFDLMGNTTAASFLAKNGGLKRAYVVVALDANGNESSASDPAQDMGSGGSTPGAPVGGSSGAQVVSGCTDSSAVDYNPSATDYVPGSCHYRGCTDPSATNYDPHNTVDDGSCVYQPSNAGGGTSCAGSAVIATLTSTNIPDPALLECLKQAAQDQGAICANQLTDSGRFRCVGRGIGNLYGIGVFTNLRILDLSANNVSASLGFLSELNGLWDLYLDANNIGSEAMYLINIHGPLRTLSLNQNPGIFCVDLQQIRLSMPTTLVLPATSLPGQDCIGPPIISRVRDLQTKAVIDVFGQNRSAHGRELS